MKSFGLMIIALILVVIAAPLAMAGQIIRHLFTDRSFTDLWWDVAIGLDQLGGSILYGEPDWTISSRTYWLRNKGNRYALWFEKAINFFFGENHCEESYQNEFPKAIQQNKSSLKER